MMRFPGRHLDLLALERFLGGELEEKRRRKVARHLRDCPSCRARFQWLRSLPTDLASATRLPLPEGMEERILARRASGERVILPLPQEAGPRPRSGRLRRAGAAVAVALLGILGGLFYLDNLEARTEWSELTFDPPTPGPGERIEVTYRPAADFAGEERLVLRGLMTKPIDYATPPPAPERLAILQRSGDVFRGAFTLAPGVVYAQVVVEDTAGAGVDDGGGRHWHVDVHEAGRPLRDALRAHAVLAPDWEDGYEVIRRATHLYPADAHLLAARLSYELEFFPEAERDSALATHREAFPSIARRLSTRRPATAAEMAGLVEYARVMRDTAAARRWTARLVRRFPRDPETVWYRVSPPPEDRDPQSLRRYLVELETLWREAGPHPAIAAPGFWAARQLEDAIESVRWATRQADHPGWSDDDPGHIELLLAEVSTARQEALPRLRRAIQRLQEPARESRRLGRTVGEHARDVRQAVRPLLARLGEFLLAEGEQQAALDTLRLAASIGWSGPLHRRVAELELAAGDTLAAAMSLARADASFDRDVALSTGASTDRPTEEVDDGSRALGVQLVDAGRWALLRRAAADERHRKLLSLSAFLSLRVRPVHLYDALGRRHTLRELSGRTVTVVAFWDPWCGPAVRDLPDLSRTAHLVRAIGGELIAVTDEPPSERLSTLLAEHRADLTLYHDLDRRASVAFQQYGAPEYFVLDFEGRIRFSQSDLDDVVWQVDALLNEPRLLASTPDPPRAPMEEER